MGKAERGRSRDREGVPGPGTYDSSPKGNKTGAVMGSGKRGSLSPKQETPGPGTYL